LPALRAHHRLYWGRGSELDRGYRRRERSAGADRCAIRPGRIGGCADRFQAPFTETSRTIAPRLRDRIPQSVRAGRRGGLGRLAVILLDTHIWVWRVSQPERLSQRFRELLAAGERGAFGVSVISCWEVAKLVEYGRLKLNDTVLAWIEQALQSPGIELIPHFRPASWLSRPDSLSRFTAIRRISSWWQRRECSAAL